MIPMTGRLHRNRLADILQTVVDLRESEVILLLDIPLLRCEITQLHPRLVHTLRDASTGLGGNERSGADLIHGNGQPNEALESVRESMEADLHMAFHTQIVQLKELAGLRSQPTPESNGVPLRAKYMHIRDLHDMLKHSVEYHSIIPICPHEGHVYECM